MGRWVVVGAIAESSIGMGGCRGFLAGRCRISSVNSAAAGADVAVVIAVDTSGSACLCTRIAPFLLHEIDRTFYKQACK
jgi:hypothetical protein